MITPSSLASSQAVSYTHLDPGDEVLIFDPHFSAYATQVRLGGGVPVFGKLLLGMAQHVFAVIGNRGAHLAALALGAGQNPVSYTHLDVYKRQA